MDTARGGEPTTRLGMSAKTRSTADGKPPIPPLATTVRRTGSRGGRTGRRIGYTTVSTRLGWLLLGATNDGICAVDFGTSTDDLAAAFERRHPTATVERDAAALRPWADALLRQLAGHQPLLDLPLDVRGTPFQERVWEALREIPYGATRSYGQIAETIGRPAVSQAVGQACAANPLALLIPCHRVVRRDGALGGYRWGGWRKHALLAGEARAAAGHTVEAASRPAA